MKQKIVGIVLLILVVVGVLVWQQFTPKKSQDTASDSLMTSTSTTAATVHGFVGGEKMGFLEDEEVRNVIVKKYGLVIDYAKAGSIEMVSQPVPENTDFLWPSSQVALEIFKSNQQQKLIKSEIIFNSPIVLYSWDIVTEAFIREGIVKKISESYYIVNFPKFINLVIERKKWSDIGLNELYGSITVISTDPTASNSGNMFAGLLANILAGDVVDETSVESVIPTIRTFFKRLGYLEHSSSDLFEQYLRTGVGAKPIIVGYESQIVEFSLQNRQLWPKVKDKIRILYPIPTVWSSHPLIALTKNGEMLNKALEDPDLQRLAWEKHGFRTGLIGVQNDPKVLEIAGIPERIEKVIPMPGPQVMEKIIAALYKEE
ncbi:MAG: hypothetical protein AB1847_20835 [bacterium]